MRTIALNKLSFQVQEGEFVAVMGPSGCGKSTLLNILGLLDDPDGGSFIFNGIEVAGFNERKRADLRKHNIGFVFQSFNLIDELTVFENVELPLIYTGVKPAERKKRVDEVLEKMQIMHRRKHFPQQLSGGQQQRVAVARAVVNNPKLILADEPTGNLDSNHGFFEFLSVNVSAKHDTRYTICIIKRLLVAQLIPDIKRDHQATGNPNGKTAAIQKEQGFVFFEIPPGDFEIVFKHNWCYIGSDEVPFIWLIFGSCRLMNESPHGILNF